MTQASLFGSPPATQSLFFALLPDAATREAILRASARAVAASSGLRPTSAQRLHVTLVYLGECEGPRQDWIVAASRAAATVRDAPFELVFDRIDSFRGQPSPCVLLAGEDANVALHGFWRRLRDACRLQGLRDAGHATFRPHVTLGRSPTAMTMPIDVPPVHWPVRGFSLLHGIPGRRDYESLGDWMID